MGMVSMDVRPVTERLRTKSHDPIAHLVRMSHLCANSRYDTGKLASHTYAGTHLS